MQTQNDFLKNQARCISHEIRNQISISDVYCEIIRKHLQKNNVSIPSVDNALNCIQKSSQMINNSLLDLKALGNYEYKTLDLNSILLQGIELAKMGYRPIPIYNGTDQQKGAIATVDNCSIKVGLIKGTKELEKIKIDDNAPPVFLLDTNRMNRFKMNISIFDNSWDTYSQDLPTAEYFLYNGIKNIIISSRIIQKDLSKILYKFQNKGINILFTNGYDKPKKVKINKPHEKTID